MRIAVASLVVLFLTGFSLTASADKMDRIEKGLIEGDVKKEQKLYKVLLKRRTETSDLIRGLQFISDYQLANARSVLDSLILRQNSDLSVYLLDACLAIEHYSSLASLLETPLPVSTLSTITARLAVRQERDLFQILASLYADKPHLQEIIHTILAQQRTRTGIIEAIAVRECDSTSFANLNSHFCTYAGQQVLKQIAIELASEPFENSVVDRFYRLQLCVDSEQPCAILLDLLSPDDLHLNQLILGSFARYPHEQQLLTIWQNRIVFNRQELPILIPHLSKWDYYYSSVHLLAIADTLQNQDGLEAYQSYLNSSESERMQNAFRYLSNPHSLYYHDSRSFLLEVTLEDSTDKSLVDLLDFFWARSPQDKLRLASDVLQFLMQTEVDSLFLQLISSRNVHGMRSDPANRSLLGISARQVLARGNGTDDLFFDLFLYENGALYECALDHFAIPRPYRLPSYSLIEELPLQKLSDFLGLCHNLDLTGSTSNIISWYRDKPQLASSLSNWLRLYSASDLQQLFRNHSRNSSAVRLPYLNLIAEHSDGFALDELRRYQGSDNLQIHLRTLKLLYSHPLAVLEDFARDFYHSDPTIQYAAVQALRRFPVAQILDPLDRQLHRDNPEIRMMTQDLISDLISSPETNDHDLAALHHLRGEFYLENGSLDHANADATRAFELDPENTDYAALLNTCTGLLEARELQNYWVREGDGYLKSYLFSDSENRHIPVNYPDTSMTEAFPLRPSQAVAGLRYSILGTDYAFSAEYVPEDLSEEFDRLLIVTMGVENAASETLLVAPASIEVEDRHLTDGMLRVSRLLNRKRRTDSINRMVPPGASTYFYLTVPLGMIDEDSLLTFRFTDATADPAASLVYQIPLPEQRTAPHVNFDHLEGIFDPPAD